MARRHKNRRRDACDYTQCAKNQHELVKGKDMVDIRKLQKEAHAIAVAHGWWDKERTFGDLIALVHSELSEALEAYRWDGLAWQTATEQHPPEGVQFELADVVIRVADMAEYCGVDLVAVDWVKPRSYWTKHAEEIRQQRTFGEWITACHEVLGRANSQRELGSLSWQSSLREFVGDVEGMAAHYGIDLEAAIEAKMEYNRTRSYRHGGKAL